MIRPLIRPVCLALWGLLLVISERSGRLDLLVRALFQPWIAAAGWLLLAFAVADGLLSRRCRSQAARRLPDRRSWLLAAAVAVAMLLLPPQPSFSDLAANRSSALLQDDALSFELPPAQRSLTDWVRLLRSQPDPDLYAGQPLRIRGFVLPQPGEPPQLARLLVRCCLADATPIGLPVRWPAAQPPPAANQWLQIEGVMGVESRAGQRRTVVLPRTITAIPRPRQPFEP